MVDEGRGTPSAASPLCPATSLPTTRGPSSWRGQRGHLSFIDQQAVTSSGPLILFIGQTDSTGSRLSVLLLELSCPSGSVQNSLQDPCSLQDHTTCSLGSFMGGAVSLQESGLTRSNLACCQMPDSPGLEGHPPAVGSCRP